jgi:hypothetical protein
MRRISLAVSIALSGCKAAEPQALACTATVNASMPLAVDVAWTSEAGTSYVEYGETDSYGMTTPATDAADVQIALLGMPEDTDVYWRGVTEAASGTATCAGVTHTGTAPAEVPRVTVTVNEEGQDAAPYVIGAFFTGAGGTGSHPQRAAFRRDGTLVWYSFSDDNGTAMDLHYSFDGETILTNTYFGPMGGEDSQIARTSMEGDVVATVATPLAHHMLCELPDGTIAYQALDTRSYTNPDTGETANWVGDAIVEVAPDGSSKTVFSVWGVVPMRQNGRMDRSIYGGLDWTHGNMLRYDASTGEYLLSLGHADDILFIDRATGAVNRFYGVDGIAADPPFDYQHDVNILPNGNLLMFMTDTDGAGAIEYARTDGGLKEVWRGAWGQAPFALGEARRLANGNTFVNEGSGLPLHEETPDGEVVWKLETSQTSIFAQFQIVSSLYPEAQ